MNTFQQIHKCYYIWKLGQSFSVILYIYLIRQTNLLKQQFLPNINKNKYYKHKIPIFWGARPC
jgi:hypothetical protein